MSKKTTQTQRTNIRENYLRRYFQCPQWLYTKRFFGVSNDVKTAYMLFSARNDLSVRSAEERGQFIDENGDIFFYFTMENLCNMLGVSRPTASKVKKELITLGLLEEVRQGQGLPNRYYLLEPTLEEIEDIYSENDSESVGGVEMSKNLTSKCKNTFPYIKDINNNNINTNNKIIVNKEKAVNKNQSEMDNEISLLGQSIKQKELLAEQTKQDMPLSEDTTPITRDTKSIKQDTKATDTTNTKKQITKADILDECNSYYSELTIGRWTKKQWQTVTERFADELIKDSLRLASIKDLSKYVKAALIEIARKHDLKHKKVEILPTNTNVPYVNWNE